MILQQTRSQCLITIPLDVVREVGWKRGDIITFHVIDKDNVRMTNEHTTLIIETPIKKPIEKVIDNIKLEQDLIPIRQELVPTMGINFEQIWKDNKKVTEILHSLEHRKEIREYLHEGLSRREIAKKLLGKEFSTKGYRDISVLINKITISDSKIGILYHTLRNDMKERVRRKDKDVLSDIENEVNLEKSSDAKLEQDIEEAWKDGNHTLDDVMMYLYGHTFGENHPLTRRITPLFHKISIKKIEEEEHETNVKE